MARWIAALVLFCATPVAAQSFEVELEEEIPDPPTEISDLELIRWASNEARIHAGRPIPVPRTPIPPDGYIVSGEEGGAIPGDGEDDGIRLLAEIGGGALGFAVGAGLGMLIIWAALEANAAPDGMMVAVAAGTTLGAFGVTSGVVLGADLTGGRGNFGYAFIGQAIGSLLAVPIVVLGVENDSPGLSLAAAALLPLAGAILAYEMSHADAESPPQQLAYVSPTQDGVAFGVAGVIP